MVLALLVASLLEGFGLISLVPVFELAVKSESDSMTPVAQWVKSIFDASEIDMTIGSVLLVTVLLMSLKAAFVWLSVRQVGYTVANVATDLRLSLLQELMSAEWRYFVTQRVGRISNSLGWETTRTAATYEHIGVLVAGTVNVMIYGIVAFLVSWQVVIVATIAGAVFFFSMRRLVSLSRKTGVAQSTLMKSLASRLTDMVHGVKPLIAMSKETRVLPLLQNETKELNTTLRTQILARGVPEVIREPIVIVFLALLLYVLVEIYDEPLSSVLMLGLLFQRVVMRLTMLQSSYQAIVTGEGAFHSLRNIFEDLETHRARSKSSGVEVVFSDGIEFDRVSFGYDQDVVIKDLSLRIESGSFVTIEGPSGTGKSTLLDLLLGLYQPTSGVINIDGVSLDRVDLVSFRGRIGYVPQEMYLFHDTILHNVTLGDPGLGRDACEEALRKAGAWDFVSELGQGVDTVVGERGTRLSGGQRQRIALARALIGGPKLLILDEVTSGLDPTTEQLVCESLLALKGNVTIVAVTHQPALAAVADEVYQLRNGSLLRKEGNNASEPI